MNLFTYAVIYVPEDEEGRTKKDECRVLVEPTTMLASDDKTVGMKAARAVPDIVTGDDGEDIKIDFDFVRVVVRPF